MSLLSAVLLALLVIVVFGGLKITYTPGGKRGDMKIYVILVDDMMAGSTNAEVAFRSPVAAASYAEMEQEKADQKEWPLRHYMQAIDLLDVEAPK